MKKILLLILLILPIFTDFAYSQVDTVWVSNRLCSTDNIAVSPDERFVVTWGADGWGDPLDPLPPDSLDNGWGNPAKVFDAQTGEWLKTFWDATSGEKNNVSYVTFSPDSSKMLVGFEGYGNLVVDLNNNFNVIDTVPASGPALYSPDMSLIVGFNKWFFDANTLEKVAEFDYVDKIEKVTLNPISNVKESVGIFRKNGREFVFTYQWWAPNTPRPSETGTGMAVIDLVDSTITLTPDVPFSQWYYRYGCDRYAMLDRPFSGTGNPKVYIRNYITDSLINPNLVKYSGILPGISRDNQYLVVGSSFTRISDGELICHYFDYLSTGSRFGNVYLYVKEFPNKRIMATRTCISYLGVPPPAIEQEIKTYPIPTNNTLNIEMNLIGGDYQAEIVDVMGRRLSELSLGYLPNGQQTIYIETDELPSGLYQVIIRSSSEVRAVKFVKE